MLTSKELEQIQLLQIICENHDNINLKLNWDMLKNRNDELKTDFFYYHNQMLAGFAAIYGFGSEAEICGMVHPDYRRRGIFSALLAEAKPILKTYQSILINAPSNSAAAKSFLSANEYKYSFSEHQMKWIPKDLVVENDHVNLRHANQSDLERMSLIDHLCFGISLENAIVTNRKALSDDNQTNYVITFEQEDVGKMRIQNDGTGTWIYAFAIHPSYQGKGIGRAALASCLKSLTKKDGESIHLDVVATNYNALKLYHSCGFKEYGSQDYYSYSI